MGGSNWGGGRFRRAVLSRGARLGKNIYVVGGATLVATLLNHELLDELRLIVQPILLWGGKALFAGIEKWRSLHFVDAKPTASGAVVLSYRT